MMITCVAQADYKQIDNALMTLRRKLCHFQFHLGSNLRHPISRISLPQFLVYNTWGWRLTEESVGIVLPSSPSLTDFVATQEISYLSREMWHSLLHQQRNRGGDGGQRNSVRYSNIKRIKKIKSLPPTTENVLF